MARSWFRRGYSAEPTYSQNWIKALGCCREDDKVIDEIVADFQVFKKNDPDGARRVLSFLKKATPSDLKHQARWRQGYQYLVDANIVGN